MKGLMAIGLAMASLGAMAEVVWVDPSYDFGVIREEDGPKEGRVRLLNRGPESVTIIEARPSCGCTSSSYPEEPVAPGDTATIRFTFDPKGRPGKFDKSLRVRLSGGTLARIPLRGNVLGTPETLAQFYPVDAGALRLTEDTLLGGKFDKGAMPTVFVNAYNQRTDTVHVTAKSPTKALTVNLSEEYVEPGGLTTLLMSFDSGIWEKPGKISIPVELQADGEEPHIVRFEAIMTPESRVVVKRR